MGGLIRGHFLLILQHLLVEHGASPSGGQYVGAGRTLSAESELTSALLRPALAEHQGFSAEGKADACGIRLHNLPLLALSGEWAHKILILLCVSSHMRGCA